MSLRRLVMSICSAAQERHPGPPLRIPPQLNHTMNHREVIVGKRRRTDMSAGYSPPAHLPHIPLGRPRMSDQQIVITETPAPQWGKTSHDAALTCIHGRSSYTVFGTEEERRRMAQAMAPAHRSCFRCRCEVQESVGLPTN